MTLARMLQTLFVKNFAIVGDIEIALQPGMTVVSGETGAGKSLMVDALLLVTGARADSAFVRHGTDRAELSASFDISSQPALQKWLAEAELDEDGACQLRRVIRAEGSSRAWINGRPVTVTQLRELGGQLVQVHGQHEHQALLERSHQLALLDAFGNHAKLLADIDAVVQRWRDAGRKMEALSKGQDHEQRIDWIEHQLAELDRHALPADQIAELDAGHRRLAHAGQLVQVCAAAADQLDGDNGINVLQLLSRAHSDVQQMIRIDPALEPIAALLDTARIQVNEAFDSLAHYQDQLELDPQQLADADAKLATLHELARKHQLPMDQLLDHAQQLRAELEQLRDADDIIERLQADRAKATAEYHKLADDLTARRNKVAARLASAVSKIIAELGMAGGALQIQLEPTGRDTPDAQGNERTEFLVAVNPGQPARPMRQVASGGELSRISLAIEVVAAGIDPVATMVFDEVDTGIGGAIAEVVGRKMRELGQQCQVLCVTHLPQVAALGHQHLAVRKSAEDDAVLVSVKPLDDKARADEIARMLGGLRISEETLAHARQMLASAHA